MSLQKKGLLRVSTAAEALTNLKETELKEKATQNALKTGGKKEGFFIRIAE